MSYRLVLLNLSLCLILAGCHGKRGEIIQGKALFWLNGNHLSQGIYVMNIDGTERKRLAGGKSPFDFSFSPDGSKVLFISKDGEVCIINTDGSVEKRLTKGRNPRFSPNGDKILYTPLGEETQTYIMNLDGTDKKKLVDGGQCRFSPDGDKILFVVSERKEFRIYLGNADGTGIRKLGEEYVKYLLGFSPDGKKLLATFYEGEKNGILIMNVDGTEKVKLMDIGDNFSFSPNSQMVTFEARWKSCVRGKLRWHSNVGVMNVDGTEKRILTDNIFYTLPVPIYPVFTPDGKGVIYEYYSFEKKRKEIRVISLDGTGEKTLIKYAGSYGFTPDGKLIFNEERRLFHFFKEYGVYIINLDGTGKKRLGDYPKDARFFSFFLAK